MTTPTPSPLARVPKTLMVAQSGGATAVINASLAGVVSGALAAGFDRVLGLRHGIEGLWAEERVPLHALSGATLATLRRTPSAALGTGRHKLRDEDLDRALAAFRRDGVSAFVYIGGNDSADTAHRLDDAARAAGQDLAVVSVPKTIDNDLPGTDHCPGYGSIARFLAHAVRDATFDTLASPQLYPVKVIEVMGRDAGWVPASTSLGFSPEEADLRPLVYLPERPPASADAILTDITARVSERGWATVVVPETLRDAAGQHLSGAEPDHVDRFGHPYYPGPALALTRLVRDRLGLRARDEKPGTFARMAMVLASPVDLDEAERVGHAAASLVAAGHHDLMTTLVRDPGPAYHASVGTVPLAEVANRVRPLDPTFIAPDDHSTTDAFRAYALPLLGPDPFPAYARI